MRSAATSKGRDTDRPFTLHTDMNAELLKPGIKAHVQTHEAKRHVYGSLT